jgi:hypothetical protein
VCWGHYPNGIWKSNLSEPKAWKAVQVSAGTWHSCAVSAEGHAYCMGSNTHKESTVPADLGQIVQISAGSNVTCAVTIQFDARCWGSNQDGHLNIPETLGKIKKISVGGSNVCAITDADRGVCWGRNDYQQNNVPEDLGQIIEISVGGGLACAITIENAAKCWGLSRILTSVVPVPYVIGEAKVDSIFTAVSGVWNQGVSFSYQWLRDGEPIADETSQTYKLRQSDLGHQISVGVSGSKEGYLSATQTSANVFIPLKVMIVGGNSVVGVYKSGKVLTSTCKGWVYGAKITYQWRLNGKPIKGATKKSFTLIRAHKGQKISLTVSQVALGYDPTSSTTVAKKVS